MGSSPGASDFQPDLRKPQRAPFERRLTLFSLLLVTPALLVSGILIWLQPWPLALKLTLLGAESILSVLLGLALRDHVVRPLQTLANVVGALREEDYSFRARLPASHGALGQLSLEVNALADRLARQHTGAVETTALLQRVVEEVDIPIFAFDPETKLRLVNSAGEKVLRQSSAQLLGRTASDLQLQGPLSCENQTLVPLHANSNARWLVRRSLFRQQGVPHTLVVLSDLSRVLREEERRAWQRLIRVLGHELNNSLAPIKSIAGSLNAQLSAMNLDAEQRLDFARGLGIIETRAASLNRFLQAYRQLAQMPPPVLQQCTLSPLVKRVAALEARVPVTVIPGPDITLMADPDQLEQMLINLLRNAAEAVLEASISGENSDGSKNPSTSNSGQQVAFTWKLTDKDAILTIEDSGPGLMNPSNVFVPFYTTKPGGSGIGLVLSRQISEAHGGSLELTNRLGQRGCVVTVTLPRTIPRENNLLQEEGK
jgi:two-component system, NtrC family, nitrogen regulation sensor histidine kinase NtrY